MSGNHEGKLQLKVGSNKYIQIYLRQTSDKQRTFLQGNYATSFDEEYLGSFTQQLVRRRRTFFKKNVISQMKK